MNEDLGKRKFEKEKMSKPWLISKKINEITVIRICSNLSPFGEHIKRVLVVTLNRVYHKSSSTYPFCSLHSLCSSAGTKDRSLFYQYRKYH